MNSVTESEKKYFYFPAFTANKDLSADMIFEYFNPNKSEVLSYICYHITSNGTNVPFLQILLQKTPFCKNIIKEEFVLPSVIFKRDTENIADLILDDVKQSLKKMKINTNAITENSFKGIIVPANNVCYGLIDLSNIDIKYLELSRNTPLWFVLPTEIVNLQSICNIPVSEKVIDLFTHKKPELCILQNPETDEYYSAPDVGYTSYSDYKLAELQLVFGPSKNSIDESELHGYVFYRSFLYAIKNVLFELGKERNIGVNRYAIFSEDSCFSADTVTVDTVNIKQFEMFHPLSIYTV
jgi:hypothetical protein